MQSNSLASGVVNSVAVVTPTLKRRLICLVYEAFLLAAVEMLATLLYALATRNQHTPTIDHGLRFVLFLVTAAYFIHFWTDSGHTLAMKTWRIKLVKVGYARVPLRAAALRFLLAWGWFLPALVVSYAFNLTANKSYFSLALVVGIVAWGCTAFLDKDRQFLHDKLAGTRLIQLPSTKK